MKRVLAVCFVSLLSLEHLCAQSSDSIHYDRFFAREINYLTNILSGSDNPALIGTNTVQSMLTANVSGIFQKGDFHAIDQAKSSNNLKVNISGLQKIDKVSLAAGFEYIYSSDNERAWHNTLYVSPFNPFTVCDSIPSDVTTEQFSMYATAAYPFNSQLTGALQIKYLTGSSADQNDPRPRANAMRFNITPGANYTINSNFAVGVNADVEFYSQRLSHYILNSLIPYTFFVMKGMGDHVIFTNADNGNYPRDYKGHNLSAAMQFQYTTSAIADMLQFGFRTINEDATDGGSSYDYKGGDYEASELFLQNRFSFGNQSSHPQNITLQGRRMTDKGYWYDQSKQTDREHGNIHYYEILNKALVHENSVSDFSVEYRLDQLTGSNWQNSIQSATPDWSLRAKLAYTSVSQSHYESDVFKQKYSLLTAQTEGQKYWRIKRGILESSLSLFYTTSLSSDYESVRGKLAERYVAPTFEYASASRAGYRARLAYSLPVNTYGTFIWAGVHADISQTFYLGDNEYSSYFDGANRTFLNVGLDLTF